MKFRVKYRLQNIQQGLLYNPVTDCGYAEKPDPAAVFRDFDLQSTFVQHAVVETAVNLRHTCSCVSFPCPVRLASGLGRETVAFYPWGQSTTAYPGDFGGRPLSAEGFFTAYRQ
jgi:hypothetical protein